MAYSCVTRIIPLLVLLLSIAPFSSSFSPNEKVTKPLLRKLCSDYDSQFCRAWLASDPKTFTLDLHGLLGLVIEKTEWLTHKNLRMMKRLEKTTTDTTLKSLYGSCAKAYETTIGNLEKAKEFARTRSYQLASWAAHQAYDYATVCIDQFDGPSYEPTYVLDRSVMLRKMCRVSLDVAQDLIPSL